MKKVIFAIGFAALCFFVVSPFWAAAPAGRIPVMLLTGESAGAYHDWHATTPALKAILDEAGIFDVHVVTTPNWQKEPGGVLTNFHPDWSRYRAIVMNYDAPDGRWPKSLENSFAQYVRNGGGLVIVHAADNAFPEWKAYNEMIGVGGWRGRNETAGPHWFYKDGKLESSDAPGCAGRHGRRIPFLVKVRDPNNPIMRGLPAEWMHQGDELYANLRGPGKNMTVLATAYSSPSNDGTGLNEPELMVIRYGKGRVFHSTWGHDVMGLSSVDEIVTLQRGTQWAATGKVTIPVPQNFPTAHSVSYSVTIAKFSPNYLKGLNPLDINMATFRGRGVGGRGTRGRTVRRRPPHPPTGLNGGTFCGYDSVNHR